MAEEALEEVEVSPAETKARKKGWSPLADWRGEEEDWVDFKDFNMRGEFMDRIQEQSSIINHLTNKVSDRDVAINDQADLMSQIADKAYKDALRDLQSQKKEFFEEQNYDALVQVDEDIAELKDKRPQPAAIEPEVPKGAEVPKEIVDWLSKPEQSWYHTNGDLRGMAEGIAGVIQANDPSVTPTDLIKQVNAKVRALSPQHFQDTPAVDEGGEFSNNAGKRTGEPNWNSLSEEQKECANRFERVGLMTKKAYIKSLVELGEL